MRERGERGLSASVMHLSVDTATDTVHAESVRVQGTGLSDISRKGGDPPVPIGAEGPHLSVDTATGTVHAESEASKIAELRN